MTGLSSGLATWAEMAGPTLVINAVRLRAQRGFQTETGTLNLPLTADERREVARLLGTPWDLSGRPVRLQDLAATLAPHGLTVRGLVEAVDGRPVDDHGLMRAQPQAAAEAEHRQAAELLAAAGVPAAAAAGWLREPGLPRAGSGALSEMARQVSLVWRRLPGRDETPVRLAQLAAESVNDSHALDARQPLGRAVARIAAAVHGLERPLRAGYAWRQAWAAVGVRCDTVSSRVLVLNLPMHGQSPAVRLCAAARGEPLWLTQRLLAGRWSAPAGITVFVCENPTVIEAAADALAADCPPLVCTDGIPSGAAMDLVAGLAAAGCHIAVRADFDDAGLIVIDQIRSVAPKASLWRYDRDSYAAALREEPGRAQSGTAPDAAEQDVPAALSLLRTTYLHRSMPVHEERLLDELLRDLELASRTVDR